MLFLISLFIFSFCYFYYSLCWCGPLWVDPVWESLWFLDLMSISLHRKVFCCYFFTLLLLHTSHCYFCHTLFLLFLRPYNANVSTLMFKSSLKLSSLNFFSFFSVQLGWFLLLCFPAHRFIPLYHLIYYWLLLVYFKISLIVVFIFLWFFFMFSNPLLITFNFLLCLPNLLLSSLSSFTIITLRSLLGWLSPPHSFHLVFYHVPSFGTYSCVTSFCRISCFYFCVFGRLAIFPDLGEVDFCRCPVFPRSALPSGCKSYML